MIAPSDSIGSAAPATSLVVNQMPIDSRVLPERARLWLDRHGFTAIHAIGKVDVDRGRVVAVFCSQKCPGDLILKTYDLAAALRRANLTVASGFQSPMERECLAFLLRGNQPIIICPARSIDDMRVPATWKGPLCEERLLVISPFSGRARRPSATLAETRNQFVAALADEILIIHAEPGGMIDTLARQALADQRTVLVLENPANSQLISLGARAIQPDQLA
jgi:predicted Rossmann fold nucleotide-binding protein DprA/Smf involved in DNA uptake